jgi:hypothetical protein
LTAIVAIASLSANIPISSTLWTAICECDGLRADARGASTHDDDDDDNDGDEETHIE